MALCGADTRVCGTLTSKEPLPGLDWFVPVVSRGHASPLLIGARQAGVPGRSARATWFSGRGGPDGLAGWRP